MRSGEIDALRCFAMTAVVALHCGLMPMGWMGVWLFFVISGFVVTGSVLDRMGDEPPGVRLAGFLRRRAVRILPVYYIYVALALAGAAAMGEPFGGAAVASLLGFFNNVAAGAGWDAPEALPTAHLWTISAEMQFYAVYGAVLCLMPRRITVAVLVGFVLLCPLLRLAASSTLAGAGWEPGRWAYAVYTAPALHFDTFAMGGLMAFLHRRGGLAPLGRGLFVAGLAALAIYCAAYVGVNAATRGLHGADLVRNVVSGILVGEHREVFLYSAVGLASSGLVALAVLRDPWVRWLLRARFLQRIGEISYGAYVFHAAAIVLAAALLGGSRLDGAELPHAPLAMRLGVFVLAYGLTLVLAWLSFEYFEKPMAKLVSARGRAALAGRFGLSPDRP